MRRLRPLPLVVLLLVSAALRDARAQSAGGGRSPAGGAHEQEIRRLRERSNAAIARHDTAGILAILAPNVMVLSSTSAAAIGRAANGAAFAEQFRTRPDVVYRRTPAAVRVFEAWMVASESGAWSGSWSEPDGRVTVGGSYFAKWRRIDGHWLVESETYVPERCAGAAYCASVAKR